MYRIQVTVFFSTALAIQYINLFFITHIQIYVLNSCIDGWIIVGLMRQHEVSYVCTPYKRGRFKTCILSGLFTIQGM